MILAGDIGGTKTNLALFERRDRQLRRVAQRRFASAEFAHAEDMLAEFLRGAGERVEAACLAVAGPVTGKTVRLTNLPWILEAEALAKSLNGARVILLNDLEATGWGLPEMAAGDLVTLNEGAPAGNANQALIAAGTGLGEAILFWDGARHVPSASEGGHADFAPRTAEEIELLRFLHGEFERVSWETVLSGRGFALIHEFLDASARHASFDDPAVDPAPEIAERARNKSCAVCARTVEMWVALYGAEAGNLALKALARGGVFIAGGIAVKNLDSLRAGGFVRSFCDKARHGELLARIPIRVVRNEEAPLLGSAVRAMM